MPVMERVAAASLGEMFADMRGIAGRVFGRASSGGATSTADIIRSVESRANWGRRGAMPNVSNMSPLYDEPTAFRRAGRNARIEARNSDPARMQRINDYIGTRAARRIAASDARRGVESVAAGGNRRGIGGAYARAFGALGEKVANRDWNAARHIGMNLGGKAWNDVKGAASFAMNDFMGNGDVWGSVKPMMKYGVGGAIAGGLTGVAGNMFAPNMVQTDNPLGAAFKGAALGFGAGMLSRGSSALTSDVGKKAFAPWMVSAADMTHKAMNTKVTKGALFAAGAFSATNWNLTSARNPNATSRR